MSNGAKAGSYGLDVVQNLFVAKAQHSDTEPSESTIPEQVLLMARLVR